MRENREEIIALAIGLALMIFAVQLDKHVTFTPFHLLANSREWQVGPRDIAHLFGMAGFTVAVWYFLRSFTNWFLILFNTVITVAVVSLLSLERGEHDWLYEIAGVSAYSLVADVLPYFILVCILLGLAAWKTPRLLGQVPTLWFSCLALIITTAVWELYVQPFDNVYGDKPRGWVEKAQVCCDLVGIFVGYLIVQAIRTTNRNTRFQLVT
jgi:hypothetical protein